MEDQIIDGFFKAAGSGALSIGWVLAVLLMILFRKRIIEFMANGANSNLQEQIDTLKNNHLHEVGDRLTNIEATLVEIRERLVALETEIKLKRNKSDQRG